MSQYVSLVMSDITRQIYISKGRILRPIHWGGADEGEGAQKQTKMKGGSMILISTRKSEDQ